MGQCSERSTPERHAAGASPQRLLGDSQQVPYQLLSHHSWCARRMKSLLNGPEIWRSKGIVRTPIMVLQRERFIQILWASISSPVNEQIKYLLPGIVVWNQ